MAEYPKGEWKKYMTGYQGKKILSIQYKCTLCGRSITYVPNTLDKDENDFLAKYPFCHCGAKMN